jgi:hypothetical protein
MRFVRPLTGGLLADAPDLMGPGTRINPRRQNWPPAVAIRWHSGHCRYPLATLLGRLRNAGATSSELVVAMSPET